MTKLGLIGQSHMGIVAGVCFGELLDEVVSVDNNLPGVNSIHEPGLNELYEKNHSKIKYSGNFADLSDRDVVFVTFDIPTGENNISDTGAIFKLMENAIPHLKQDVIIVLMSQVPVGFNKEFEEFIHSRRSNLDFRLYYCVETLVIGNAVERFLKPERMIVGCKNSKIEDINLKNILGLFNCPIIEMCYESAEITKMAINLYLATSVTYANTLSDLCEKTGGKMNEIIPALRLDRRIGQYSYIQPGLGIAGGNLERDLINLQALSDNKGLIDLIIELNKQRYTWANRTLAELNAKNVAMWGISYKKDTAAIKNSFAINILKDLHKEINFKTYDPRAVLPESLGFIEQGNKYEITENMDCLIITNNWDEYKDIDYAKVKTKVIIDCVGILDPGQCRINGFKLIQMGG